jgi:hypothetical protein
MLVNCKAISLFILAFGILVFYTIYTIPSYAQLLQPGGSDKLSPAQVPSSSSSSLTQLPSKIHGVKITSPVEGQQVPISKDLGISGTSLANATSQCQISVGVNRIKPYQNATAAGPGGATDYSKWNFVLTPKYTTIKEGPNNKITARYSCNISNPNLESFDSVNVTGITTPTTPTTTNITKQIPQQQQPVAGGNQTSNSTTTTPPSPSGIPGLP